MGEMEEDQGKDQYMSSAMAAIQRYGHEAVGLRAMDTQIQDSNTYTGFRASIDKLRRDNHTLKEELYLENKFSITPIDNAATHRITAMQDEADALTRKVCPGYSRRS